MSPHLSSALMACLVSGGGAYASGDLGRNFTGVCGWDGGGGGMILSLKSFRAWSVASARLTLERSLTVPVCTDV